MKVREMEYKKIDKNTPGFLWREKKRQEYLSAPENEKAVRMIEWLAVFVEGGPEEVENASEAELNALIAHINEMATTDPKAPDSSEGG